MPLHPQADVLATRLSAYRARLTMLLSLLSFTVFIGACGSGTTEEGNGIAASASRPLTGFESILVSGEVDVSYKPDVTTGVVVACDSNLVPLIETTVANGVLSIGTAEDVDLDPAVPCAVSVLAPDIDTFTVSGSGDLAIDGIAAETLTVAATGSGDVRATGTATGFNIVTSGSGDVDTMGLVAVSANLSSSGSGDIQATVSHPPSLPARGDPNLR